MQVGLHCGVVVGWPMLMLRLAVWQGTAKVSWELLYYIYTKSLHSLCIKYVIFSFSKYSVSVFTVHQQPSAFTNALLFTIASSTWSTCPVRLLDKVPLTVVVWTFIYITS